MRGKSPRSAEGRIATMPTEDDARRAAKLPTAKRKRPPASHAIVDAERAAYARGAWENSDYVDSEEAAMRLAIAKYPYPRTDDKRVLATAATAVWRDVIKTAGFPIGVVTHLQPLVKEHGLETVMRWWRQYLEAKKSEPQYLSVRVFASRPDKWAPATPAALTKHFTLGDMEGDR